MKLGKIKVTHHGEDHTKRVLGKIRAKPLRQRPEAMAQLLRNATGYPLGKAMAIMAPDPITKALKALHKQIKNS